MTAPSDSSFSFSRALIGAFKPTSNGTTQPNHLQELDLKPLQLRCALFINVEGTKRERDAAKATAVLIGRIVLIKIKHTFDWSLNKYNKNKYQINKTNQTPDQNVRSALVNRRFFIYIVTANLMMI